jgi:hypothetical protein
MQGGGEDVADRVVVPFAGEGSGTGELTWGQKTVWRGVLSRNGAPIWLIGIEEVADGRTIEDIAGDFTFLISRHQALRTRLIVHSDDWVEQVVSDSGEITLDVVDAADDVDPRDAADAAEEEYSEAPRDYAVDWPVRATVIRHRGVPRYVVTCICHSSVDGFGTLTLKKDLDSRDQVTGEAATPMTAMQPLELARWQVSPAGQRRSAAVERHWDKVLRTIPPRRFRDAGEAAEPFYWRVTFSSRALFLAAQAVAARAGYDTSPVLLAGFAAGMAKVSGINPTVPRVMVNNRFRPRLADSVGPLSQTCPCVIDVAGITFDKAVRRAYSASLVAFKNAYFEPVRIREILMAASEDRGTDIDVDLLYNDRRSTGSEGDGGAGAGAGRGVTRPLADRAELAQALTQTTLTWESSEDPMDVCHVHVLPVFDTIDVMVFFNTHYISPGDIETVLRHMETTIATAAHDPSVTTGV